MYRLISTALLTAAIALGGTSIASAQSTPKPVRQGNVYVVPVCGAQSALAAGYARCHANVVTDASGNFQTPVSPLPSASHGGFGSADIQGAYVINTTTGSSSTVVAIVDAFGYNNAEADLGVYRSFYGLPACTTANGCFLKLNQNGVQGNYPAQNSGWGDETALDLDMVSSTCPKCHILLVEANTNSFVNLAIAENTAVSGGGRAAWRANVVSNSYGGGEGGSSSIEATYYNHPGIAITASTGDDAFAAGPQFPATSPHVIAVGGTHLVKDSSTRGWTETVWADAGSGCSTVYAKPSWQHDALCTKRMEADVSAVADPNTGVAVYGPHNFGFTSGWLVFGGTSVSVAAHGRDHRQLGSGRLHGPGHLHELGRQPCGPERRDRGQQRHDLRRHLLLHRGRGL